LARKKQKHASFVVKIQRKGRGWSQRRDGSRDRIYFALGSERDGTGGKRVVMD